MTYPLLQYRNYTGLVMVIQNLEIQQFPTLVQKHTNIKGSCIWYKLINASKYKYIRVICQQMRKYRYYIRISRLKNDFNRSKLLFTNRRKIWRLDLIENNKVSKLT